MHRWASLHFEVVVYASDRVVVLQSYRNINRLASSRAKKFKASESLSKIQCLDLGKMAAAAFNLTKR